MTTPPESWDTERIAAKPAGLADAEVVFDEYARDPEVSRYMTWTPHRSIDETREFLDRCERAWADGTAFPWTLWHRENHQFLGLLEVRVGAGKADLGYALVRRYWRQGLMSEAVSAVVQWALDQPTIHRVWAVCDRENVASARLLERVGMEREGILRRWLVHPNLGEVPRDCLCYAAVKPPPPTPGAPS